MKTNKYIYCLATLLLGTACTNEDISQSVQKNDNIQFIATLQHTTAVSSRTFGNDKGEKEALPYVNNIRIRKIDQQETQTELFHVRTGNYGTLDMEVSEGITQTAMKWTDKVNDVDFFAWTVPTGVSISPDATTGSVNFGQKTDGGNQANTNNICDQFNDEKVAPLEIFISAYKSAKFTDNPSVNLDFKHVVGKVSVIVHWWTNKIITDDVTITFPYINEKWNIQQIQNGTSKVAFSITDAIKTSNVLSLDLKSLSEIKKNYRTFYLPPIRFADQGDFEIKYQDKVYYGSLSQIANSVTQELKAGQHITFDINLNPNFNAGGNAWINPWKEIDSTVDANPYQGIYTLEGLQVLKKYLESNEPDKELSDSLYIEGTGAFDGKKIIQLYNDLTLPNQDFSLALSQDMIFDGLGHTITVPTGKSLFGDISATGVQINNIRLQGAGQLANSLTNVTVYNCHANGTGNLVGTADNTTFNFCSAQTSNNPLAQTISGTVTMQNCFVAYKGATQLAGTGTVTAKNSFVFNTTNDEGNYYDNSNNTMKITADATNGQLIVTSSNTNTTHKLIDLLNTASNTLNTTTDKKYWVYVYGKNYPVMKIK